MSKDGCSQSASCAGASAAVPGYRFTIFWDCRLTWKTIFPSATVSVPIPSQASLAWNMPLSVLNSAVYTPSGRAAAGAASAVSGVSAAAALSLCAGTVLFAAEVAPQPASSRAASVRIRSCFFICLSSYTFFVFCDTETAIARFHPKTARRQILRAEVTSQPFRVSIAALVCATYRA